MKFMTLRKDGGPESTVWGFFVIEIKLLFSIVILRFEDGSRDVWHTHAFNAISWVLKGQLFETELKQTAPRNFMRSLTTHRPSFWPIFTPRECLHKVVSIGRTYAISFRGPWAETWTEYDPKERKTVTLTHGRTIVSVQHD